MRRNAAVSMPAPSARRVRAQQPRWLEVPIAVTLVLLAVAIALATPPEYMLGAVLAYFNLIVVGAAALHFVQRRTLQGLIPVLFLAWFAAGWSLPTIYFATFFPTAAYHTYGDHREFVYGAARVQSVGLAFLISYLTSVFLFEGHYSPWSLAGTSPTTNRRMGTVVLCVVMAAITLHATSQIVALPAVLVYVAGGSYNYLHGLMLMIGVLFLRLPMRTRVFAALFMLMAGAFYLIGNARGLATLPAALFVTGLLFLSEMRQRHKTAAVVIASVALVLALVIGNTTRALLGSIGFSDIGTRLSALGQWQEVLRETPVLADTFHRLFFVGGHSIIAYTPEYFPYVHFSPASYLWELLTRLLPGKLFYDPFYSTNERLEAYGFQISEESSYPMSLLGSLYMLGGIVPVIIGAFVTGMFHAGLGRLIGSASRRSQYLALFIFSMVASTLIWSQNVDFITIARVTAWRVLSAVILYYALLRPLAERSTRRRLTAPRSAAAWAQRRRGVPAGGAMPSGPVAATEQS